MYPLRTQDWLDLSDLSFLTIPLADLPKMVLSRGLEVHVSTDRNALHSGQNVLHLSPGIESGAEALGRALELSGAQFLGLNNKVGFLLKEPADHAIEGDQFVEALIHPADLVKSRLRAAAERVTGAPWSNPVYEHVLFVLTTLVGEGHFASADLDRYLSDRRLRDAPPYRYAFYYANIHIAIEDMRTVLLRAMNRFSAAIGIVRKINEQTPMWHEPLVAPWEIRHSSPATQALYDNYVDCLLACSSTLDLLYKLLLHVATEPLGDPAGPSRVELPLPRPGRPPPALPKSIRSKANDLGADVAPYALSNLGAGAFFGLKGWRNELTHNLGPVAFELPVYVGEGGDPVKGAALRYTQFMAPDLATSGDLASHAWVPRLYKQRRDALDQLHGWLEETVLATHDTLRWLIRRLDHRASQPGNPASAQSFIL